MIYKIFRSDEYTDFVIDGRTEGSQDDKRDGFIHFSTFAQLPGTLAKHYVDEDELFLLSVNEAKLGQNLKWEESRGGALFPHLYGTLERDMVEDVHELDGHKLPKGLS